MEVKENVVKSTKNFNKNLSKKEVLLASKFEIKKKENSNQIKRKLNEIELKLYFLHCIFVVYSVEEREN